MDNSSNTFEPVEVHVKSKQEVLFYCKTCKLHIDAMDVLDHRQHDVVKATEIKSEHEVKNKSLFREILDHLNPKLDQLKQII